jgi:hypothetical protein
VNWDSTHYFCVPEVRFKFSKLENCCIIRLYNLIERYGCLFKKDRRLIIAVMFSVMIKLHKIYCSA